jgi:Mg2+-importing ATPase
VDPLGTSSERVFLFAYLNSSHETGVPTALNEAIRNRQSRDPLDNAVQLHDHPQIDRYRKIDEVPFDFERRRVSVVVEHEQERLLITKGAPEGILSVCTSFEVSDEVHQLSDAARVEIETTYRELCAKGFRTLALAYSKVPTKEIYDSRDEENLVLLGFLSFSDPPLESANFALQALRRAGVQVKILTGDNELVTKHVCSQVGFDGDRVILGEELERMSDPALNHIVEEVSIFARVSPSQKNRIIMVRRVTRHPDVGDLCNSHSWKSLSKQTKFAFDGDDSSCSNLWDDVALYFTGLALRFYSHPLCFLSLRFVSNQHLSNPG